MTNYKEAILAMIDNKENRKKELLAVSKKLQAAIEITNDDMQLMHRHDIGFNFPALKLSVQGIAFPWNDWKAILVIKPMGSIDYPRLEWSHVPDDETLENLVKELSRKEKSRPD